jgi:hypothetical protein
MFRAGLAIYLSIAHLAGPWLCCCVLLSATVPATAADQEEAGEAPPPCCCCQQPSEPDPAAKPRAPAERAPADCPCHQRQKTPAPVALAKAESLTADRPLAAGWVEACLCGPATCQPFEESLRGPRLHPVLPFVTADDLLRLHHVLRC